MSDQMELDGVGGFTLRVNNFRAIKRLEWSPQGVCLLAGYNGAGKSTILEVLTVLRSAYLRGVMQALSYSKNGGGRSWVRHRPANLGDDVRIELEAGEVTWRLELPTEDNRALSYYGEHICYQGKPLFEIPAHQSDYVYMGQKRARASEGMAGLKIYETLEQPDWLKPFVTFVRNIRSYGVWNLPEASEPKPERIDDSYLHPTGKNLAYVLRNWRVAPRRYRHQFEWVRDAIKDAFPDLIVDMESIDDRLVFYPPHSQSADDYLPMRFAADGLLTALLQLTAVAGATDGSVVAFDEIENQLHPHAIRSIVSSMRKMAKARNLTILLTTHSPVVMNAFREEPEQFYVLEPGETTQPVALTDLHDEDWLAQFSLGDLYDRMEFGAPPLEREEG